jgi:hypothetical protein
MGIETYSQRVRESCTMLTCVLGRREIKQIVEGIIQGEVRHFSPLSELLEYNELGSGCCHRMPAHLQDL